MSLKPMSDRGRGGRVGPLSSYNPRNPQLPVLHPRPPQSGLRMNAYPQARPRPSYNPVEHGQEIRQQLGSRGFGGQNLIGKPVTAFHMKKAVKVRHQHRILHEEFFGESGIQRMDEADVSFICKDGIIRAHRVILAASSQFFADLFEDENFEESFVSLPDVSASSLGVFLRLFYTNAVNMTADEILEALELFRLFRMDEALFNYNKKLCGKRNNGEDTENTENKVTDDGEPLLIPNAVYIPEQFREYTEVGESVHVAGAEKRDLKNILSKNKKVKKSFKGGSIHEATQKFEQAQEAAIKEKEEEIEAAEKNVMSNSEDDEEVEDEGMDKGEEDMELDTPQQDLDGGDYKEELEEEEFLAEEETEEYVPPSSKKSKLTTAAKNPTKNKKRNNSRKKFGGNKRKKLVGAAALAVAASKQTQLLAPPPPSAGSSAPAVKKTTPSKSELKAAKRAAESELREAKKLSAAKLQQLSNARSSRIAKRRSQEAEATAIFPPAECPICGTTEDKIVDHINKAHKDLKLDVIRVSEAAFKCLKCHTSFALCDLVSHYEVVCPAATGGPRGIPQRLPGPLRSLKPPALIPELEDVQEEVEEAVDEEGVPDSDQPPQLKAQCPAIPATTQTQTPIAQPTPSSPTRKRPQARELPPVGESPVDQFDHVVLRSAETIKSALECRVCGRKARKLGAIADCYQSHGLVRCSICYNVYRDRAKYNEHLNVMHTLNGEGTQYFCCICQKNCVDARDTALHIYRDHLIDLVRKVVLEQIQEENQAAAATTQ